ncbi:MAG: hypothetical protein FJW36_02985 [Acidobacteria bacterium]|nr:hypothetical protein [Acidobacteriota bacterium]
MPKSTLLRPDMKLIPAFLSRLLNRNSLESSMEREFQFHLESRTEDLLGRNSQLSHAEAYRQAKIEFGGTEHFREECRASLGYRLWDQIRLDLRFATRVLGSNRGFTLTAVSILALAIGVNTCFFSLFNQFILKPLPIQGVERNYWINAVQQNGRTANNWSPEEYAALVANASSIAQGLYSDSTVQIPIVAPQPMPPSSRLHPATTSPPSRPHRDSAKPSPSTPVIRSWS